jgi:hypothetical protein
MNLMNKKAPVLLLSLFCTIALQAGTIKSFKMDSTSGWRSFPVLDGGAFLTRMDVGTPDEQLIEMRMSCFRWRMGWREVRTPNSGTRWPLF